jgi:hypothetical protein
MSTSVLSIQTELRRLGFRPFPGGEDFQVYTELFVNDVYRIEQIKRHVLKDPAPDATVIIDLGANKNWFLHLLEEKVEIGSKVKNVCYFRVEPQPLQVTYPVGGPINVYHVNRAIVPTVEDHDQFLSIGYNTDFTILAGSPAGWNQRVGSEVSGLVVNEKYAEYIQTLVKNVSTTMVGVNVETIGVKRLFDRITEELARLNVARHRALIKIDCEYQELTIASDVLSYISQNERWKDFLLVAETAAGGTFETSHRKNFVVEEYMEKTGLPDEWSFKVPYLLAQPK